MAEAMTIGSLADQVRSKNAGPFWLTIDIFLPTNAAYELLAEGPTLDPERVAALYRVASETVEVFLLPDLRVIKISFPRPVPAGSFDDRDAHGGQQHLPLSRLEIETT